MQTSVLTIQQGIDSDIYWDITDANDQPADLTGFSAQMEVRTRMDPTSTLLQKFNPVCVNSRVLLKIDSEETYNFTWSRGKSTLVILDANGQPIDIVWSGSIKLSKIATRVEV